jgi:teichuronic acid biosynthesis glycosyltransferase TuaH
MLNSVTVVFISLEPWDEVWRRNQFLCDGLLRKVADSKILFVQPPCDNSHALRSQKFTKIRSSPLLVSGGYGGRLRWLTPIKWFPKSLPAGRVWNEKQLSRQIKRAMLDLGWTATHLWINEHEAAHLLCEGIASNTLYDITDDWTKFSGNQSQLELITCQDATLCKSCDHVIVCSQQLFDDKAKLVDFKRIHLIPNGVQVEHYEAVVDTSLSVHKIAEHWTKPVFGYTGTIHGDRVDVSLVAAVAKAYPSATIAMVGPNLLNQTEQRELNRYSNVVFTGSQRYIDLPDVMRAFDVCMVPHLVTPFTESLNPIKLWEYLAAGKPVVSTNVAGFRDYPDLVSIADKSDDFVSLLDLALSERPDLPAQRQEVARQHTWDQRIKAVEVLLVGNEAVHVG